MVLPDEASVVRNALQCRVDCPSPTTDSNTAIVGDTSLQEALRSLKNGNTVRPAAGKAWTETIFAGEVLDPALAAAVGRSPSQERQAVIDPLAATAIKYHLRRSSGYFPKESAGDLLFARTSDLPALAWLATFVWALFVAATLEASSSMLSLLLAAVVHVSCRAGDRRRMDF